MTSPLLRQLAAFCRQHPVARKCVFVPSRQVGYNLGSALAREGVSWVNLELVTPLDHARAIAAPVLAAEGYRPLPDDARLLLVEQVVAEVLDADPGSYFAEVPRSGGLARAFLGTLKSLRLSGLEPADVDRTLTSAKGRFIAAAYQAYRSRLDAQHYYDDARVFEKAIDRMPLAPGAVYAILDETSVAGLAGRYIESVAGSNLVRVGVPDVDLDPPYQSAADRLASLPRIEAEPAPQASRSLYTCIGSEGQLREVLRAMLASGVPLDAVEIVYTSERPFLTRLVDLADRFGVPLVFGAGIPVGLTRPGQALLGFLRWIESDLSARELVALARGGLLDPILPADGERALRGYELAREIRLARIGHGRDQYARQLQMRLNTCPHWMRRNVALSQRAIEALLKIVDEHPPGSMASLAVASIEFLDRFARVSSERDRLTIDALQQRLRVIQESEIAAAEDSHSARRLIELIEQNKIDASTARPGAAYVVPLARAGYSGRKHVYVVGLDETSFPGSPTEDPVLLDDERSRLSPALGLLRTGPGEKVWHLHRLMRSGVERIALYAHTHTVHDAREVYPCALFQEWAEETKAQVRPLVPGASLALDATEWYLARPLSPGLAQEVAGRYPSIAAGYFAADARRQPDFNVFRGWIGEDLPAALVPGLERPTSASRLETLVACPYRFFLRDVLRVRPPDDPEDDPSLWITRMESGSLIHDVCHRFMLELGARGERANLAQHLPLLEEMLECAIEAKASEVPIHNPAAFKAERARLHRAGKVFLADESRRECDPYAFEFSFGKPEDDEPTPVALRLSDDMTIVLCGRIDRIDRVDGGFELWDYKTGS
ncbi:MAG TPA: PD-(D/E)XK nuclease family protein, partial [Rhodothermales bacterium]